MEQKLEEKDENTGEIKETFSSLQQEVESKTKRLKKVSLLGSLKNALRRTTCQYVRKGDLRLQLALLFQNLQQAKSSDISIYSEFVSKRNYIIKSALQCWCSLIWACYCMTSPNNVELISRTTTTLKVQKLLRYVSMYRTSLSS